jgi:carbon-monoxide dehydrogenase medium subunit
MYPNEFDYHRARSVDHAVELLAENPDAEVLAGGHSLLPMMKSGLADPPMLVDIGELDELRRIDHTSDASAIGALVTYSGLMEDDTLRKRLPLVPETAEVIGDVQVRNRGTIGGNLTHADPASDMPATALALDTTLVIRGPGGERTVSAEDFFHGMYMTDVGETELLTRVKVDHEGASTGTAYRKKPSPSSGYALVGVAAVLETDDGAVKSARVAANGMVDHPVRLNSVEAALEGTTLSKETVETAAEDAAADLNEMILMDDMQASGEFRAQLLDVYTERALTQAADRAGLPDTT